VNPKHRTSKTSKKPRPEFDHSAALKQAEAIRLAPPARAYIRRPELLTTVVFQVAIPSHLCIKANRMMRRAFAKEIWTHAANAKALWDHLKKHATPWLKYKPYWPIETVSGRPQVVATEFSSNASDVGSNPAKKAIDMLTVRRWINRAEGTYTKHRIGIIRDDSRKCVEQIHHWEFMEKEHPAFILLEVRI
jgi:hypothetical protein